ncbi:MAG: PrsW family intramembrane metalloprotease [Chitinophagaceae bacterium]|nr:PrsW family intramembrane metalloprotease [Chitinophagaceae bacterium]
MLLLGLAIAPGIAIVLFIYFKDSYDKEPWRYLLASFFLGALSVIPPLLFQIVVPEKFDGLFAEKSWSYYAFQAFAMVAFSEELSKFIMVRYFAFRKPAFNEPFDGIVYSVIVSMGFATVENIGYVMQHGFATAILRMFLSVPAHASFGVIMGFHIGLAKFSTQPLQHFFKGLLLAILFHGCYDYFLFLLESKEVTRYVSEGLLVLGALLSYFIAIRVSLRSIREGRRLKETHLQID